MTHSLGLEFRMRPDGEAREIVDVPETVNDFFSSRTHAITPKHAELNAAFAEKYGREPNRLESYRLGKQATFLTRRAKSHTGQPREAWLEQWDARLREEISGGLGRLAEDVMAGAGVERETVRWSPVEVIETAFAAVQAKKAAWTKSDLIQEINMGLPDTLDLPEGADVAQLLDTLGKRGVELAVLLDAARPGDEVLPDELRRADGESMYQAPARGSTPHPSTSPPSSSWSPPPPTTPPPAWTPARSRRSWRTSPAPGCGLDRTRRRRCAEC